MTMPTMSAWLWDDVARCLRADCPVFCDPVQTYPYGDADAGAKGYLAVEAVLPDLNEALAHVDVTQSFWSLPRTDLRKISPSQARRHSAASSAGSVRDEAQ